MKIAMALKVPIDLVGARWEVHKEKGLLPSFDVNLDHVKDMDEAAIKQAMGAVWRWLRDSLDERFRGLAQHRGQALDA